MIEFILLSVYITGCSRIISSGVADWNWYWTSKLCIWTIADGSYWSVSSWKSKIYIWKSLESLSSPVIIGWMLSSFADWSYWSLSSFNKQDLYLENIQRYWLNKLIYLMILIDEHYHLDEQCSWISHLELTSHHSGQTLWWIKLLLDCYHSCFDIIWINWMTMLSHISWNEQYSHLIIYILKLLHVIEHCLDGAVFSPASVRTYIWWSINATQICW